MAAAPALPGTIMRALAEASALEPAFPYGIFTPPVNRSIFGVMMCRSGNFSGLAGRMTLPP